MNEVFGAVCLRQGVTRHHTRSRADDGTAGAEIGGGLVYLQRGEKFMGRTVFTGS
jgi:hypothetical protein